MYVQIAIAIAKEINMDELSAFACFMFQILSWQLYYFSILEHLHKSFIVVQSLMQIFRIKIWFYKVVVKTYWQT